MLGHVSPCLSLDSICAARLGLHAALHCPTLTLQLRLLALQRGVLRCQAVMLGLQGAYACFCGLSQPIVAASKSRRVAAIPLGTEYVAEYGIPVSWLGK